MKSKATRLKEKKDKELQTEGREKFKNCEVCGNVMTCLHHFFPKKLSDKLRYEWDNLIPICSSCHLRHHRAQDPTIHATIIKQRGWRWYNKLIKIKNDKSK